MTGRTVVATEGCAPSHHIPARYLEWARDRQIVVVAGANQAIKYWRRIRNGLGSDERPFNGTQSIDAAITLMTLAGVSDRVVYGWGFGFAVDPACMYVYRHATGATCRVRFVSTCGMGNAFNYTAGSVRRAACQLSQDIATSAVIDERRAMFVGCSLGAAVIDYGKTAAAMQSMRLKGPGIALGGPRVLLSWRGYLPSSIALSTNGDAGDLWVQRHPHDPIGWRGVGPVLYPFRRRFHDYRTLDMPHDARDPHFWGINA